MTHRATGGRPLEHRCPGPGRGRGRPCASRSRDGEVIDVQLNIYEPPRFFEGFLRGRAYTEPPDITARICGICPVAYQMSACAAIEDAVGVAVDGPLRDAAPPALLRRVDREPHAAHPPAARARLPRLRQRDRAWRPTTAAVVERGLEVKKIGNEILETVGGRAIHPVNVQGRRLLPGADPPRSSEPLRDRAAAGIDAGRPRSSSWVAALDFPDQDDALRARVRWSTPTEYPMLGERVVSDRGLDIGVAEFRDHVEEHHVEHSTALHARLLERGEYLVGPLARYSLHADQLGPSPRPAARAAGLGPDVPQPVPEHRRPRRRGGPRLRRRPSRSSTATSSPTRRRSPVEPRAGVGHGVTEAPRGLLYHRYEIDERRAHPDAVHHPAHLAEPGDDRARPVALRRAAPRPARRRAAPQHWPRSAIRNHDPCISCATHFLDMEVRRR